MVFFIVMIFVIVYFFEWKIDELEIELVILIKREFVFEIKYEDLKVKVDLMESVFMKIFEKEVVI